MSEEKQKNAIGVVLGIAFSLAVVYVVVRVAGSAWAAGSK